MTQFITSQQTSRMAGLMAYMQEEHLMTPEQLSEEFFSGIVDRAVKAGELDAELGKDTSFESMPMMSEEEFQQIVHNAVVNRRSEKSKIVDAEIVWEQTPPAGPVTELSIGKPRVIGKVEVPMTPLNEFHEKMLQEPERLVLGGCIPSVKWSELDSIIKYLEIFRGVVSPDPDVRLGKPARTPAQIQADTEAEASSPTYLAIVKKLRRRILVDGQLDLDSTRRLNDAGFTVSYIPTLKQLTIAIAGDFKLSWEV